MKTTTEKQKAGLIRKYHTLCGKLGMSDEDRRDMLFDNYGAESSKELSVGELQDLCESLQSDANKEQIKLQEARSRVFGAVGGWLDIVQGRVSRNDIAKYRERVEKIKAIACRQTQYKDFNRIPLERLQNVSFLFSKKQKDFKRGDKLISDDLQLLTYLN
jgi:hypothetical protein